MEGRILRIFIAPTAGAPMDERVEVQAFAGKGLEGDRYFDGNGTYSGKTSVPKATRHVTLIESEAIEALVRDYGIAFEPNESRRNLLTQNVALNHLVGREFTVGGVRLRGIKLCEPCGHLEKLTGKSVRAGLTHRGGLNAEIVISGTIRVGDRVDVEPEEITQKVAAKSV